MPRWLGVDWGRKRVGIALSDELGLIAHPRDTLEPTSLDDLVNSIATIVQSDPVEGVVLGLPQNMDGSEGPSAFTVRQLAERLQAQGLVVHFWDERLSSREADDKLRSVSPKKHRPKSDTDRAAAALVLQGFLTHRRNFPTQENF